METTWSLESGRVTAIIVQHIWTDADNLMVRNDEKIVRKEGSIKEIRKENFLTQIAGRGS